MSFGQVFAAAVALLCMVIGAGCVIVAAGSLERYGRRFGKPPKSDD